MLTGPYNIVTKDSSICIHSRTHKVELSLQYGYICIKTQSILKDTDTNNVCKNIM